MTSEIAFNRRARHEYAIEDTLEAGIVLSGLEIKAVRKHSVNLAGSHARIIDGELYAVGLHIASSDADPLRNRKLLVKKTELHRLIGTLEAKRRTVILLKMYLKGGWAKVLLGIGQRKGKSDKRETLKKRAMDRSR